jgi:hypothetical protein
VQSECGNLLNFRVVVLAPEPETLERVVQFDVVDVAHQLGVGFVRRDGAVGVKIVEMRIEDVAVDDAAGPVEHVLPELLGVQRAREGASVSDHRHGLETDVLVELASDGIVRLEGRPLVRRGEVRTVENQVRELVRQRPAHELAQHRAGRALVEVTMTLGV